MFLGIQICNFILKDASANKRQLKEFGFVLNTLEHNRTFTLKDTLFLMSKFILVNPFVHK